MNRGERLYSSGHLAQLFQMSVFHVRAMADKLGIEPMLWINDIDHFDTVAVLKMTGHVNRERDAQSESIRKG
jgi:hypothetical protein